MLKPGTFRIEFHVKQAWLDWKFDCIANGSFYC